MLEPSTLNRVLHRGVAEIIVEEEFVELLQKGKPLRLKMGFDPSWPDIHLGHVVGLRKLRQLQELGHQVTLIVGDWTAQIGDPSGQTVTRPMLTSNEVMANAKTYLAQFYKVVDKNRTETVLQSEWFGRFTLSDVIDLTRRFTVAQLLERDDFAKRFQANKPIALTEFLYPLLQAYDSVAIRSDVEFGGTDQKFNLLVGRELQSIMDQRPQQCFLMPMLVGTDGVQKMSKSLGNYVAVDDPPSDMYGKIMSLPDTLLMDYFEFLTDVPDEELEEMRQAMDTGSVNPMELKQRLATEITSQFHGVGGARKAQEYFQQAFQLHQTPEDIPRWGTGIRVEKRAEGRYQRFFITLGEEGDQKAEGAKPIVVYSSAPDQMGTADLLLATGLASSRNEAKRLVAQGAVEIDGRRIDTPLVAVKDGSVVRAGKRRFVRLVDLDKRTSG